jgi:manganese-dependent inorganic pyrophosphatase
MQTIIIGHKNLDTDSVLSAISYAELKSKIDPKNQYIPTISGSINNETKFILDYFSITTPKLIKSIIQKDNQIIIVDHTDEGQLPDEIDTANIIEVIDHHRLGGLQTTYPIIGRIEPIGSTSTIIAKIFKENNIIPAKEVAGLMLSGIISDTLFLQSPTSTDDDKDMLFNLSKISQIPNVDKYASQMFKAKSDIGNMPIQEVVTKDYKEFKFGKNQVGIGVWETIDPESILKERAKLISELNKFKNKNKLNFVFFLVVDILRKKSDMIIIDPKEQDIAEQVFGGRTDKDILHLDNVVSRKKQVVPPLERFLK